MIHQRDVELCLDLKRAIDLLPPHPRRRALDWFSTGNFDGDCPSGLLEILQRLRLEPDERTRPKFYRGPDRAWREPGR